MQGKASGEEMSCQKMDRSCCRKACTSAHHFQTHNRVAQQAASLCCFENPLGSHPTSLLLQTVQQSLEVAQEACNDLDLRATQVGCC